MLGCNDTVIETTINFLSDMCRLYIPCLMEDK